MKCETIRNYRTGMLVAAIIMTIVTYGQLNYTGFIVKGDPVMSFYYATGFICAFVVLLWITVLKKCECD